MDDLPRIPLGDWIEGGLDALTEHISFATKAISSVMETGIESMVDGLMALPPWAIILLVGALGWWLGTWKTGILMILGLVLVWDMELWLPTMQTLTMVIIATGVAVLIGLPLGIVAAFSHGIYRVIMPILVCMQTMPAFVYLIPAIPFFGLGAVSAIFSTVIFAMPPAIRLTCLGIRQLPEDLIEAADAFGSTRSQKLFKVQLPVALPTIMAGVNQTIMLSLSMVVIAAMIGAQGLGAEVWKAIQRLQPGMGFEAGIAVVILAMIMDRISQKVTARRQAMA